MVIFAIGGASARRYSAVSGSVSAIARLLRTCSKRVATAAANTRRVSTTENAVQGKCGVVNSLTKFFDDCTGSPFLAMSWPASSVARSKSLLYVPAHVGLIASTVDPGYASPTSVAISRIGVSIGGLVEITTILRSMPCSRASATTCRSSGTALTSAGGTLTPSSRTSANTWLISTSGGIYDGRNGITCGPATREPY